VVELLGGSSSHFTPNHWVCLISLSLGINAETGPEIYYSNLVYFIIFLFFFLVQQTLESFVVAHAAERDTHKRDSNLELGCRAL
jgi:hypothetical protein